MLTPNLRCALHPILPRRMGFSKLLSQMQPTLARLIEISNPYTLVSARNRVSLYRLAEQTMLNGIAGDFVEIGVHRGGSAAILAGLLKECDPTGHRTLSVRPMGRSTGHDGGGWLSGRTVCSREHSGQTCQIS
ncbi:MAG: hypothetical protein DI636_12450 [Pelagerythrobacter marensis]|nr:MAG: hypothetical protein DI636_12450 [Pelagerythrobacter marensis]